MRSLLFILVIAISLFNPVNAEKAISNESLLHQLSGVNAEWPKQPECNSIIKSVNVSGNNSYNDWIAMHLMLVEKSLRARDVTRLSHSQQVNRKKLLNELGHYWHIRGFPVNDYTHYKTPVFIDRTGNHCAVGYLMQQSGYEGLARKINAKQKFAYVRDIKVSGVKEWADEMGFTLEELAWIQPTYIPTTQFSTVDSGVNGEVIGMATGYKELVFAGNFDSINNMSCLHIGYYENNQLGCIGGGLNGLLNNIGAGYTEIVAAGSFRIDSVITPLVKFTSLDFDSATWQPIEIPGRSLAIGTATFTNGDGYEQVALYDSSNPKYEEIWYNSTNGWEKNAIVHGTVYCISQGYNDVYVYAGAFDSAIVYRPGMPDTLILTNNVLFGQDIYYWSGLDGPVSDTVHVAKYFGDALYLAGTCSDSAGRSNVCLTRYLNEISQPLIFSSNFYGENSYTINDLALFNTDNLILAGDFTMYYDFGQIGNYLASYDMAQSYFTPIGDFDNKVLALGNNFTELLIGGNFTSSFTNYNNQPLNHLAKMTSNATSIHNLSAIDGFNVYPNPAYDYVKLQLPDNEVLSQIQIADITGRVVYEAQKLSTTKDISVAALSSGVYVLRVLTNNGWNTTRIVKE